MDNIEKLYAERNAVSKDLFKKAFNGELDDAFPYVINNANYFVFGEKPELIPDNYFQDPAVMYDRQVRQFQHHYDVVKDHYVPYLMPFMGTGVACSAFGARVEFKDKMDPTATGFIVENVEQMEALEQPDVEKDGLCPHVLKFLRYFKEHSDIPIGITDCQGPLTTALQLLGYDKLFYWMYDYPEKIHKLMELVTDTLIKWIKKQKEVVGMPMDCCWGNQGVYVPEGIGVWLSDDDAVLMPPALYDEFVAPYNDMLMKAFGGGIVHFCGTANHLIDSFNKMKYLRGINNFSLGDAPGLCKLRNGLRKDLTIVCCDFTPLEYKEYYKLLFEDMKLPKQNIIVQSLFSPVTALKDKKYEIIDREESVVLPELEEMLRRYSNTDRL